MLNISGNEIIPSTFGLVTHVTFVFGADARAVPCSVLCGTWIGSTSTSFESGISAIFSIVLSSVSFSSIRMVRSMPSILPMSSSTDVYRWGLAALSAASYCKEGYLLSSIWSASGAAAVLGDLVSAGFGYSGCGFGSSFSWLSMGVSVTKSSPSQLPP